ncbi:jg5827 [Pararge aegeria aegeria]|uniref:Jg5827 protein n=1 Tax=Pararge aegeria aegeria TaxID=348720 RepID=A0A8S4RC43_9NEOP|nr:jg5827 [Pararge aegeria aegeria]
MLAAWSLWMAKLIRWPSVGQCIESKAKTAGKKLGILNKVKRYFAPEQLLTLYQAKGHAWSSAAIDN